MGLLQQQIVFFISIVSLGDDTSAANCVDSESADTSTETVQARYWRKVLLLKFSMHTKNFITENSPQVKILQTLTINSSQ